MVTKKIDRSAEILAVAVVTFVALKAIEKTLSTVTLSTTRRLILAGSILVVATVAIAAKYVANLFSKHQSPLTPEELLRKAFDTKANQMAQQHNFVENVLNELNNIEEKGTVHEIENGIQENFENGSIRERLQTVSKMIRLQDSYDTEILEALDGLAQKIPEEATMEEAVTIIHGTNSKIQDKLEAGNVASNTVSTGLQNTVLQDNDSQQLGKEPGNESSGIAPS